MKINLAKLIGIMVLLFAAFPLSAGITSHTLLVQINASVATSPAPRIVLSWKNDCSATNNFVVYRRPAGTWGSANWGSGITVAAATTTIFTDDGSTLFGALSVGSTYEYRVEKVGTTTVFGNIWVGIEEPAIESRGKLILMVDDRFTVSLAPELARLVQDMTGDGWEVMATNVSVAPTDALKPWNDAPRIKGIIQALYNADTNTIKAVFLFGHFPIPYSGRMSPDGHKDHYGAWPADVYYADMNGVWTDSTIDTGYTFGGEAILAPHLNFPGDGKFDQNVLPGDTIAELELGRVDLYDMPAFRVGETELLRRYLEKDHAYRHRAFNPLRRGMLIDGFGDGTDAYRNQSPALGSTNVFVKGLMAWISVLADPDPSVSSYLCAYGAGGGQPTSNLGIGTTTDEANNPMYGVFYTIWGSYNGVWDLQDSLLRAPVASQPWGLTSILGTSCWNMPEMGLGRPIGFSIRRSMSRAMAAQISGNGAQSHSIYLDLMGDPTLRLFMVAPPANVTASGSGADVVLSWSASIDTVLGYHVYRSLGGTGAFVRVNGSVVSGTTYTDVAAPGGTNVYQVRAVKLESVNSGTYYNLSQGIPVQYPTSWRQVVVTTAGGNAQPPVTNALPFGSYQALTVPPASRPGPDSQYACTWTGTGSVPSRGQGTNVTFFLDRDSTIQWQWAPNQDSVVTVTVPSSNYTYGLSKTIELTATANDPDGLVRKVEFELFNGTTWDPVGTDWNSIYHHEVDAQFTSYKVNGQPNIATYRLNGTTPSTAGGYAVRAKATDSLGAVTLSAPMTLTGVGAAVPPAVVVQPLSQSANVGERATFSLEVSGTAPFTYSWRWNANNNGDRIVNFVDFPTYTTVPATSQVWYAYEASPNTKYTVVVSNAAGVTTSAVANLTVIAALPTLVSQPSNQTVTAVGQPVSFQVKATGVAPLLYQWRKNGATISSGANASATNALFTIPATAANDIGAAFSVVVNYPYSEYLAGTNISASATVTIASGPPVINTQPTNQTVLAGQTASFTVSASGTFPLVFQWRTNGVDIADATNESHLTAATVTNDSGKLYSVVVSNAEGCVTSVTALLTVNAPTPPTISTQPANQAVTAGQTASFSVTASGTAPLYYQWRTNGVSLSGATASSYTTPATATKDSGTLYSVVVSNAAGSVTSSNALLTVTASLVAPAITSQPTNQTVAAGQTASFSVTASGTAPLFYQWRTNGASLAGATANTYSTPATATNDTGTLYSVVVSNTAGSATSVTVVLTVNAPVVQPPALPFSDSFEAYAPGFNVGGANGWTAEADGAVVTTLAYKPRMPPGYPLPAAAHSRVLQVNSAAQNTLPGVSNQNVNVDFMLQPTNGVLVESLGTTVQLGLAVDTQGVVQVWHSSYDGGSWTQKWTAIGKPPLGTSGWVRVSIALDYSSNAEGQTLFRPFMNGVAYPTAAGVVSPTDLTPSGSWYVCANSPAANGSGQKKISGFKVESDNPTRLDDFIVTLDPFAYRDPPISAILIVK